MAKRNEGGRALSQAEAALRRSEDNWERLFQAIPDIVMRLSADGTILAINRTATGRPPEQFLGLSILDYVDEAHRDEVKAELDEVFRTGLPAIFETLAIGPQGPGTAWYENRLVPVGAEGAVSSVIVISRDITERREAEETLRAYQGHLRSLASELSLAEERERRRVAAVVHDTIAQNLAMAKIKLGALREGLARTRRGALLEEVRQLVDETITDARSLTLEISPPVLYELGFEPAVEWLTEQMEERHGIETRFQCDGARKPLGEDVQVLLFQAVRELLANVAKHAGASRVWVTISSGDHAVTIEVRDDGAGFDAERLHAPRHSKQGFGLFSIRERLQGLGGSVDFRSEPGKGTTVTLTAPLTPDTPIEHKEP